MGASDIQSEDLTHSMSGWVMAGQLRLSYPDFLPLLVAGCLQLVFIGSPSALPLARWAESSGRSAWQL
jgi:hypothetical protein